MNMQLMIDELRRDEGERLKSYRDTIGLWTIGVGHLIDPEHDADPAPFGRDLRNGATIMVEESAELLSRDITSKMAELDQRLSWWRDLDEVRQRVILNLAFNLGVAGLLTFKNTLAFIRQGDYAGAARNMLQSKWADQVGKQEGQRAYRLAQMMELG
jgi:lysozyme